MGPIHKRSCDKFRPTTEISHLNLTMKEHFWSPPGGGRGDLVFQDVNWTGCTFFQVLVLVERVQPTMPPRSSRSDPSTTPSWVRCRPRYGSCRPPNENTRNCSGTRRITRRRWGRWRVTLLHSSSSRFDLWPSLLTCTEPDVSRVRQLELVGRAKQRDFHDTASPEFTLTYWFLLFNNSHNSFFYDNYVVENRKYHKT